MSFPVALAPISRRTDAQSVQGPRLVKIEHKLRVLQVGKFYPPHPGGMESHLEALCAELKDQIDLEVIVAASNSSRTTEELIDGVKVAHLGRLFTLRSAPMCPTMVRRIHASKADLVHIHWPNPPALLAYLASGQRGRLVLTYHSDIVRQKMLGRVFDPILRRGLQRADAIIVSSGNYINSSDVLREYREKCHVIPFGIHVERFERPDELEVVRLRKQFGPRMVLTVGRLVYYKGFDRLIAAMKSVDGHLVIVGSGALEGALRRQIEICGLQERVTLLTEVRDTRPYYHAAEVFVLPSIARSEAFGIVQLEAMASGKPVVNTRLDSGVTSVSIDGQTGLTVPPRDSEALSEAITSLLNNPARRVAYGRAARLRAKQHFTLESMAEQTLALYREVLNSHVV
jgi:glycosyltransferase involved in cell wall biosynthesis